MHLKHKNQYYRYYTQTVPVFLFGGLTYYLHINLYYFDCIHASIIFFPVIFKYAVLYALMDGKSPREWR